MTVVRNRVVNAAGDPVAGVRIRATVVPHAYLPDGTLLQPAHDVSDDDGRWELDLLPNAGLTPGGTVYHVREGVRVSTIAVPDGPGPVELVSLLAVPPPIPPALGVVSVDGRTGVVSLADRYTDADHPAAADPHGDRAYADAELSDHVAAADPHGDRAYADAELLSALASLGALYLSLAGGTLTGNLGVAGDGKGYRFRVDGGALDTEAAGADWFLSVFSEAGFGGAQRDYLRLEAATHTAHASGRWRFAAGPFAAPGPLEVDGVGGQIGFFGAAPASRPAVTGDAGGNAALGSLLAALASLGLIEDNTE